MQILTELIKIVVKKVVWDKSLNIHINGEGNDYPERMERFRDNSVTATMGSSKFQQFVIGQGFGDAIDRIEFGGMELIHTTEDITRDIVNECGVFVLVRYNMVEENGIHEVDSFEVVPFKHCRVGFKDDRNYNGKILVYPNWHENNIKKDKVKVYDVFNPKLVKAQINAAKGFENYKGQILYYNLQRNRIYPNCRIHTVAMECDNENLATVYKNRTLRFGFFGKTIVVTRPLLDSKLERDKSKDGVSIWRKAVTAREDFVNNIKTFLGADQIGGAMHLEVEFDGDDLTKAVHIQQIESKINDKLFAYTESSACSKILMANNNLPEALVKSPDTSLFGTGGVALRELKRSFQQNVEKETAAVERIVNKLVKYTKQGKAKELENLKLIKLIPDEPVAPAEAAKEPEPTK